MGRKATGNVQFNTRVSPKSLRQMRKLAKAAKVRLGVLVEAAFVLYIESQQNKQP